MTHTPITPREFEQWSRYIQRLCGVYLEPAKTYLIESRLSGLVKTYGCRSFSELYDKAIHDATGSIEKEIIDRITTNETQFFRDVTPFELLKYKIMPDLLDRKMEKRSHRSPIPIHIWSAACAMGQEVYSIAIVLKELLEDLSGYDITILGTDISGDAVARASKGSYNRIEIQRGLSEERRRHFFVREGDHWKVTDEIRAMVTFRKLNLASPFTFLSSFDIIFCRNVAIYFHRQERRTLFERIANVLDPQGYLIIGATETLTDIMPEFEPKRYLRSVFYQLGKGEKE